MITTLALFAMVVSSRPFDATANDRVTIYSAFKSTAGIAVEKRSVRGSVVTMLGRVVIPESAESSVAGLSIAPGGQTFIVGSVVSFSPWLSKVVYIRASDLKVLDVMLHTQIVTFPVWTSATTLEFQTYEKPSRRSVVRIAPAGELSESPVGGTIRLPVTRFAARGAKTLKDLGLSFPLTPNKPYPFSAGMFKNHTGPALISRDGKAIATSIWNPKSKPLGSNLVLLRKTGAGWKHHVLGNQGLSTLVWDGQYLAVMTRKSADEGWCELYWLRTLKRISRFQAQDLDLVAGELKRDKS